MLLTVELDCRPGEETPRVTVRGARPLDSIVANTRLRMVVAIDGEAALAPLAGLLGDAHNGNGEIVLSVPSPDGPVKFVLGRDFTLDADLHNAVERLPGIASAELERIVPAFDDRPERPKLYAVK